MTHTVDPSSIKDPARYAAYLAAMKRADAAAEHIARQRQSERKDDRVAFDLADRGRLAEAMHQHMLDEDAALAEGRGAPPKPRGPDDGVPGLIFDIINALDLRQEAGMGRFFPPGKGLPTVTEVRALVESVPARKGER